MTLSQLKDRWNDILDHVEKENRIAWLAYFDARLVSLHNGELILDFSDPDKLSGAHDYTSARSAQLRGVLEKAIATITDEEIRVIER